MALTQEIDAALKEFTAAIKDAEEKKKLLVKHSAEIGQAGAGFGAVVKDTVGALNKAKANLDDWQAGYDAFIEQMKSLVGEYSEYKKKSATVEKFYATLLDEKEERDKARKKQGSGTKPSKQDEIADAAFKRAKTAYDNDPGRSIDDCLKQVANTAKDLETQHKGLVDQLKEASDNHAKMSSSLMDYCEALRFRNVTKAQKLVDAGPEFDKYFSVLK